MLNITFPHYTLFCHWRLPLTGPFKNTCYATILQTHREDVFIAPSLCWFHVRLCQRHTGRRSQLNCGISRAQCASWTAPMYFIFYFFYHGDVCHGSCISDCFHIIPKKKNVQTLFFSLCRTHVMLTNICGRCLGCREPLSEAIQPLKEHLRPPVSSSHWS